MRDYIFAGTVDKQGRLQLDNRASFLSYLSTVSGKRIVLAVTVDRATRSARQLRWEFGIALPLMAVACGYERNEVEQLHYELLAKHYGTRYNRRLRKYVPKVKRSRQLNTADYAEHQEWLCRFAAEFLGVVIPLPNEPTERAA